MSAYDIEHQTVNMPLEEIRVGRNIANIRTIFDDASIKELAEGIFHDGLLNPLVVMPTTDPDTGDMIVELVCGARRLRAIQYVIANLDDEWGEGEVRCTQYAGTLEDAKLLNAVENIERENIDDVDTCAWLFRMVEDEGRTQDELATRLHRSAQWVSLRITVHRKGSDELKKALREGLIRISTAYELAKNLTLEDQDKRIAKARANNEKLIKLDEAEVVANPNKVPRPSKKRLGAMLSEAERASANPKKRNAHGVAMGLRFVLGLCSEDEVRTAIQYEPGEDDQPAKDVTDEPSLDEPAEVVPPVEEPAKKRAPRKSRAKAAAEKAAKGS